jgi:arginine:ornithine antiporter/lysine permease
MHFTVLSGVRRAAGLNVFASLVNIITIGVTLVIIGLFARRGQFSFDVWGQQQHLGSLLTQVKSTMLVTLWVFLGIEAAVVVSDRAEQPAQVGTATFLGLVICAVLYFLLSALPFGVMHQGALAGLGSPSAAYLLQALVGNWGAILIDVLLLFSTLFCWLAWTILVAELPYEGAKGGVFPKFLSRENRYHAAAPSLWMSSIVMQATMFVLLFAHDAWIWLISITGVVSLPPYLASTAFLWLYASKPGYPASASETARMAIWTGILGTLYSAWLLYAAGAQFMLVSSIFYAIGLPVFWYARRERAPDRPAFAPLELAAAIALVFAAIAAVALFAAGTVGIA